MQQERKQKDEQAHLESQLESVTKKMEEMKITHEEELESKVEEFRQGMRKKAIKRQQSLKAEIEELKGRIEDKDCLIAAKETENETLQATIAKREAEIESLLERIMQQERKQKDEQAHLESQLESVTKKMEEMKITHEEELESKVEEFRQGMRKKAIKRQQSLKAEIKQLDEQIDEMDELIMSKEKEIQTLKASTIKSAAEIERLQRDQRDQEQKYKDEIMSLERQLEVATKKMEEMKRNHKKELDAKVAERRNGMPKETNDLQYLKSEVKRHRRIAEEHLIACWEKDSALVKERKKTAELQKKVEELMDKQAENARKSETASRGKEHTAPVSLPRVSKITGVDEIWAERDQRRRNSLHLGPQKTKFNKYRST